jgi:hypothetical protein
MFKIKMALIVAVGLFIHTPRDWSHGHPRRPAETLRLSHAKPFVRQVAAKETGQRNFELPGRA